MSGLLSLGSPDWSRKGVYAYWDRDSHDLLYLGLATDLPTRFAQHNGVVRHGGGNKKDEIDAYFSQRSHLGFTIVIQGAAIAIQEEIGRLDWTLASTADELIAVGEGQIIETHRLVHGSRPPWNKTGGSRDGKRWATSAPPLLDLLAARRSSLFVARRSLRDLENDQEAQGFEAAIHASRMRTVMDAHDVGRHPANEEDAVRIITRSLMLRDGHLVDGLDASDEQIRRWIRKLADPAYWQEEGARNRAMLEEVRGHRLRESERQVVQFLESIFAQAAPPEHVAASKAVFSTGYLSCEPRLPSAE